MVIKHMYVNESLLKIPLVGTGIAPGPRVVVVVVVVVV
jgi:hypothetical protein